MFAEDEDFRDCNRIEPPLDPAPYRREEGWGANYLPQSASALSMLTSIHSQISCPRFLGNAPWPGHWHLAYVP